MITTKRKRLYYNITTSCLFFKPHNFKSQTAWKLFNGSLFIVDYCFTVTAVSKYNDLQIFESFTIAL